MLTTVALALVLSAPAQDPMMASVPKKELSAISFLLGHHNGKGTGSDPSGQTMKMTGSSHGVMEYDRWLNMTADYDMGGMGKFGGRLMVTYNATAKRYEGVWCDSMSEFPLTCKGYIEGKYLVFMSDPAAIMPGEEPTVFKIVYSKEAKGYNFSIKMKMGEQWMPAMAMNYTKK